MTMMVDSNSSCFVGQEHFFNSTCTSSTKERKPLTMFLILPTTLVLVFLAPNWQARRESNPQPSVLETDALPVELQAYAMLFMP